jgi:hypothetical protein
LKEAGLVRANVNTPRQRVKDLAGKFLLAFISLLASLVILELATRLFFPQWGPVSAEQSDFWHYDSLLGWSGRPGQTGRIVFEKFNIGVSLNSQGLRDDEYPLERVPGKKRMLVLGDSFGWGVGVEHDEIFVEVLEKRHPEWEIINGSQAGYGTDQEILLLEHRMIAFRPDIVLLIFCVNDFYDNNTGMQFWYHKPYFTVDEETLHLHNTPVPTQSFYQRMSRLVADRTYALGRIYYALIPILQVGKDMITDSRARREEREAPCKEGEQNSRFSVTRKLLHRMKILVESIRARCIVVSIPMNDECRNNLQSILTDEEIAHLALDSAFAGQGSEIFVDRIHWTASGHQIAADAVDAFLHNAGVFSDSSQTGQPPH